MLHKCKEEPWICIETWGPPLWHMFDYGLTIKYCPFCGVNLSKLVRGDDAEPL